MSARKEQKRADYIKQGGILAIASLLVRIIGMVYRIPMSNILGEEGNGIYAVAFEIYDVILIISSYSLPLALSKIISSLQAKKQHRNTGIAFRSALAFGLFSGGFFGTLLFAGAGWIERHIYPEYGGVQIPLHVLAPTIFIVALLGVFRGFFQGKKTMIPTAFSQVVEQIVNAVVSVAASYLFMKWNINSIHQAAWGAAGGTLGTCLGAASALLIVLFVYWIYRPVQEKLERRDRNSRTYSNWYFFRILIITILPIVLSQTVYNISGLIDYKIFGAVSGAAGMDDITIKSMVGVYSSKYRVLCSVPIAISTAMASSMIPSAVTAYTERDEEQWCYNVSAGIKINMIIAIPCAVAFLLLGGPIVKMLFASSNYVLGGHMLTAGGAAIVFYALSNITGGALQSIDKMRYPVIHSAISLVIHIAVVVLLLKTTDMGIYALIVGNIIFPIVVFILNYMAIRRFVPGYVQEMTKTFLAPVSASVWMGIVLVLVYRGAGVLISSNTVCTLAAIAFGVLSYFVMLLVLKGLTRDEMLNLPMGYRLYRLAKKLHLMK